MSDTPQTEAAPEAPATEVEDETEAESPGEEIGEILDQLTKAKDELAAGEPDLAKLRDAVVFDAMHGVIAIGERLAGWCEGIDDALAKLESFVQQAAASSVQAALIQEFVAFATRVRDDQGATTELKVEADRLLALVAPPTEAESSGPEPKAS